jgi:hypothetical protein
MQGSYPTLIVTLVCLQKSPVDHYSARCSTGIRFASSGPNNRLSHVMSRQVYAIRPEELGEECEECMNDSETEVPSAMLVSTSGDEKRI